LRSIQCSMLGLAMCWLNTLIGVCQVRLCAQHGIHQKPNCLLIWKSLQFIISIGL
jgi:hypothetical protein